jgi:hypothetical protein
MTGIFGAIVGRHVLNTRLVHPCAKLNMLPVPLLATKQL